MSSPTENAANREGSAKSLTDGAGSQTVQGSAKWRRFPYDGHRFECSARRGGECYCGAGR